MLNLLKLFSKNQAQTITDSPITSLIQTPQEIGIVDEIIEGPYKPGRVRFKGSWWPARCALKVILKPGEVVHIIGMDNITLLVEPLG